MPHIIREMYLTTTTIYHYTTTRMVKVLNTDNTKCSRGYETTGIAVAGENAKWFSHLGREVVSKKTKMCSPSDSPVVLPGIYPNEFKTYVHTKTCTQL